MHLNLKKLYELRDELEKSYMIQVESLRQIYKGTSYFGFASLWT